MRIRDQQHPPRPHGGQERGAIPIHAEQDEVGQEPVRVQGPVLRLGDAARAPYAGQLRQTLGEPAGVGVVLGQAVDHAGVAILERDQPGRGEDAHLAHAATDELARTPRAVDERGRADDHGADGRREPLREAEGDGVRGPGQNRGGQAERHGGVEEPGTVHVEGDAALVGDRRDRPHVLERERAAAGMGVRVLENDQARGRLVDVRRIPEGLGDLGRVQRAVRPIGQGTDRGPDDDGVSAGLVHHGVRGGAGDGLVTAGKMGQERDEVAHRAAGDEQAGLLAEELRGACLQGVDRGIVAEDVVADLGGRHRAAHRVGRMGHRIGAKVDAGHGPASISRVSSEGRAGDFVRGARAGGFRSTPAIIRHRSWTRGVAAQHASLSRWRSPVRIRSGPPSFS